MRGVAALLVVFHHYNGTAISNGFSIAGLERSVIGNIGVDIFFVISGFIMEFTAGGRTYVQGDARNFLLRRGARIFPLYWALTIVAFGAALVLGSAINSKITPEEFLLSMLLLPTTGANGKALYVIAMAWSLTYESYFYALFASLLRFKIETRLTVLAGIFAVSTTIGFATQPQAPVAQLLVEPMLFEFLAGCLLAHGFRRGWSLGNVAGWMLLALSIGLMLLEFDYFPLPDKTRVVFWGIPAAMMVYGVVLSVGKSFGGFMTPLVYLGDISYSLYLSHFFTLAAFVRIYEKWTAAMPVPNWLAAVVLLALCLLVSHICYKLIESPSRRMLSRFTRSSCTTRPVLAGQTS